MMMYDYDKGADEYAQSNAKPDKLYSILPTILGLLRPSTEDVVLDVGCGDGFFTKEIAKYGPKHTIGIDISEKQIEHAKRMQFKNVEYKVQDMFDPYIPRCNIINAPFVLNCVNTINELDTLIKNFYAALYNNGKFVATLDIPKPDRGKELDKKKWGAIKRFNGKLIDEIPIIIDIYNQEKNICNLNVTYYSIETVCDLLYRNGFREITGHKSSISNEGVDKFGEQFWNGYIDCCELEYISAKKYH